MDIDSLVNESYEHLIECQNILHELDMKMVKCEHHCIINENANMMMLAEGEFTSKVVAVAKTIWNKVIEKLEEFIIFIRDTINKFRRTFLLNKNVEASFSKVVSNQSYIDNLNDIIFKKNKTGKTYDGLDGDEIHINSLEKTSMVSGDAFKILGNPEDFNTKLKDSFKTIIDNKEFNEITARQALENFSNFRNDSGNIKHSTLTKNEIINAYRILTNYGDKWIGLFEKARDEAKKKSRLLINANPDKNAALQASTFQRMINKGIMYIQSIMTACFKVCYAIKNIKISFNFEKEKQELLNDFKSFKQNPNKKDGEKLLEKIKYLKTRLKNENSGLFNEDKELENNDNIKDANITYTNKEFLNRLQKDIEGTIDYVSFKKAIPDAKKILNDDEIFNKLSRDFIEKFKNKDENQNRTLCLLSAIESSIVLFKEKIPHTIFFGSSWENPISKNDIKKVTHVWVIDNDNNRYESNIRNNNILSDMKNNIKTRKIKVKLQIDSANLTKEEYIKEVEDVLNGLASI